MKVIILFIIAFLFAGCDEFQWDLPRDNPEDMNAENTGNKEEEVPEISFSQFDVYSDDNSDQKINPGESVSLRVYLENIGNSRAVGVKASFSTSSNYITNLDNNESVDYNTIYPDDTSYPEFASSFLSFDVSSATPAGTEITFYVDITDSDGNTWQDEFTILVSATDAHIEFSKFDVYSDDNNDQQINPGESVSLRVYLENTGTSRAMDVQASFTTSSAYITNLGNNESVDYNTIYPGDMSSPEFSSSFLSFDVSSSIPAGTTITFDVEMTDKHGNYWEDNFSVNIQ